ncbi:amidase [Apiospora hydei]|uniref:Amidase n=1 Tax=Apiospora hydei TaxID=1337664 RepID=A0ABR1VTP5_9PEZI
MKVQTWEQVAARKRKAVMDSIPADWIIPDHLLPPDTQDDVTTFTESSGWFTTEELSITNSDALELLPKLASGELKSETVTRAFCKRAAAAHQLTNCLSETCFDRGLKTARQLDEHLARTGKPVGPLHGLPVSLKDNFHLKGLDATVGFVSHVDAPADQDATLAELLQTKAGAVFYVKTNVPTAMMMAETVNNVQGRTVNPLNRRLTPGGSSGGEAALIAPLGVGTDIGGSLRIPAACTGLFTLRPSFGRFPTLGCRSGMPGQEAVQSVNGPLARTLGDLEIYCRAVVDAEPWHDADPRCLPIPWRMPAPPLSGDNRKLKIAVMWDDGMALPTPPVTRALRQTVASLQEAGHDIVEWSSRDQAQGLDLLNRMFVADGGLAIREEIAKTGEPWFLPEMQAYAVSSELGTRDLWRLHAERQAYQKRHLDRWNAAGIDALLCPTTPYASVENGKFRHVGYTGVYNVLDQACISFPTGIRVDAALDKALDMSSYQPMSEVDKMIQSEYHAEAVHGMPINLQLIGRRLEEEKVVAMVKVVLDALS